MRREELIMPKIKVFGNLMNRIAESGKDPVPKVGDGLTIMMHSDRHPGTVTYVSKNGGIIKFREDKVKIIKGSQQDGSAEYEIAPDPTAPERVARRNRYGQYKSEGSRIVIGKREEYYDPSF
jgi:hypothetical protein